MESTDLKDTSPQKTQRARVPLWLIGGTAAVVVVAASGFAAFERLAAQSASPDAWHVAAVLFATSALAFAAAAFSWYRWRRTAEEMAEAKRHGEEWQRLAAAVAQSPDRVVITDARSTSACRSRRWYSGGGTT